MRTLRLRFLLVAPIASILPGMAVMGPSFAQDTAATGGGLEEVVVTARRREESLQNIPLSITAFTAEDIQRRNIQEMEDVARFTPGFNFEDFGGSGYATPVIRGTSQNRIAQLEQNVSSFFDGVYLPRSYTTDLGFANIERIEVVKGPQSARYGRNAFMGAINYIPKKPTDQWEINADVTLGDEERRDGAFAVSGPLGDVVRFRVSADHSEFDGTWDNTHPFSDIGFQPGSDDKLGGWERDVLHAAVQFVPSDDVVIEFSYYDYEYDDEHDPQNWFGELNADSQFMNCGQWNPDVRPAGAGGFGFGGEWFRLYCGELPVRNIPIDPRGYSKQLEGELLRASVNWQINDNFDLEYIFGSIEAESKALGYKDTLPGCSFFIPGLCVFENGPIGDFETDSHEIRLSWNGGGNVSAAFGLYYFDSEDFGTSNFSALPLLTAVPTSPVDVLDRDAFLVYVSLRRIVTRTEVWSPFAEVSWSFADDRARLGIEARYSSEEKKEFNLASGGGEGVGGFEGIEPLVKTFDAFTPRVTLEYDLTDDNMLFGSIARGVKSGGFNGTATLERNLSYDQDQNWTYEIGARNAFMDGRVQLNATLFYIDWSDVQISAQDEGNPNPLPVSIIRNLGDVTSTGIELDGAVAVNDNLTVYGTFYLGDAEYDNGTIDLSWGRIPSVCDDVVCSINGDISGNKVDRQSRTQASLGIDWQDQLTGDFDYYIRADAGYQSKMYAEPVNLATISDRTVVNASFGIYNDRYSVQLWARNLFDEEYISSSLIQSPNAAYNAYLGERRTIGVTASVKWRP